MGGGIFMFYFGCSVENGLKGVVLGGGGVVVVNFFREMIVVWIGIVVEEEIWKVFSSKMDRFCWLLCVGSEGEGVRIFF